MGSAILVGDTRSNGLELRQLAGVTRGDAVEEYDSQESDVFETRETWFTDTQRHSMGEAETQFIDGESDDGDNGDPVPVRVRFSQEEMRWEGEEREEEEEEREEEEREDEEREGKETSSRQTDSNRVRFIQDVEVLQVSIHMYIHVYSRTSKQWTLLSFVLCREVVLFSKYIRT